MLDHYSSHVHNNQQVAALPQLDRGSDYESERHRFESYTPHQLKLRASGNGGFSNMRKPLSIDMFVRARFETGLFRFPSGGPAHAARLVDACLAS